MMEALNCWNCLNLNVFLAPQFFHELSLKDLQIALEEFLDELRPLVNFFMIFTHPKPPPSLFGVNVFQRLIHFVVVTGSIKRLKKY